MKKPTGSTYYGEYLKLPELTNLQQPESKRLGNEAHDEMLFIIVHQVYELWFRQINHEFDSIIKIFSADTVEEKHLGLIVERIERVIKIQSLLLIQLEVMETMTPMDFLEFRDLLIPASGFQSVQFRQIEITMGLSTDNRESIDREYFLGRLNKSDRKLVEEVEKRPSILELIETWLERMPFTDHKEFNFWDKYKESVAQMLQADEDIILENVASLTDKSKEIQLENLRLTRETFDSLFDAEIHDQLIKDRKRKLSQKALLNALFILLYRDEAILYQPFKILKSLMDLDENFTTWRHRHALMAHRMLGTKIGTGGSSGHQYLKRAADNNRVYIDLFDLSTFLIPKSERPELPRAIKESLGFSFRG